MTRNPNRVLDATGLLISSVPDGVALGGPLLEALSVLGYSGEWVAPFEKHYGVDAYGPAQYIANEIMQNLASPEFAVLQKKFGFAESEALGDVKSQALDGAGTAELMGGLVEFGRLVRTGGIWDHKNEIRARWGKATELNGAPVSFDVWSNIHYGFIGSAAGIDDSTLLLFPAMMQVLDLTVDWDELSERMRVRGFAGLDDERDQRAIELGIRLFKEGDGKVSVYDIVREISCDPVSFQPKRDKASP